MFKPTSGDEAVYFLVNFLNQERKDGRIVTISDLYENVDFKNAIHYIWDQAYKEGQMEGILDSAYRREE
jgi:hypothetical protein